MGRIRLTRGFPCQLPLAGVGKPGRNHEKSQRWLLRGKKFDEQEDRQRRVKSRTVAAGPGAPAAWERKGH